jgi:hypothetical protein
MHVGNSVLFSGCRITTPRGKGIFQLPLYRTQPLWQSKPITAILTIWQTNHHDPHNSIQNWPTTMIHTIQQTNHHDLYNSTDQSPWYTQFNRPITLIHTIQQTNHLDPGHDGCLLAWVPLDRHLPAGQQVFLQSATFLLRRFSPSSNYM